MGQPAQFEYVDRLCNSNMIVIQDVGDHSIHLTITNDLERVIATMLNQSRLTTDQRLVYFDSEGEANEVDFKVTAKVKRKKHDLDDLHFIECDACRRRAGATILCGSCLNNRRAVNELRRLLVEARKKLKEQSDEAFSEAVEAVRYG